MLSQGAGAVAWAGLLYKPDSCAVLHGQTDLWTLAVYGPDLHPRLFLDFSLRLNLEPEPRLSFASGPHPTGP